LARRKFLPEFVTVFVDRHGKERYRFRRKGFPSGYFKAELGTDEFRAEYRAFMDAGVTPAGGDRAIPGSVADLVGRYFATPTRLGPTEKTQASVRGIIGKFRDEYGQLPVNRMTFEHVEAIVAARIPKRLVGKRMEGGLQAARKLRKELIRLFAFAKKIGMTTTNPAADADRVKIAPDQRSPGYHTWTEDEIAQYREHHKLGTKPRLAMELMLWTDQRRGDAIRMGRQHIREGRLHFTQGKTGRGLGLPVAPQLLEAIVAMSAASKGHLCFLTTEYGKPFSDAGFGNWFRAQCDAAGLPQCSAHGLRKATMRRMAELGMSNQTMKSVSGHATDQEVSRYTRAADQQRMADSAIGMLAKWEIDDRASNSVSNLDAGGV
jgi:integrase